MPDVSLHSIGEEIWEYSHPITFWGLPLPHRMTVMRLSGEKLVLHSPTRCDPRTIDALRKIGTVTEIIAPNRFHDLFLEEWLAASPQARLWIPPGMHRYFPKAPGRVLELSPETPWPEIACLPIRGLPVLNETVFFHVPSKAVIVADLLFNLQPNERLITRAVARLGGFYRRLAMPLEMKLFLVRDRGALKQSVREISNLPFEKVVIGHGANILAEGRREFSQAFQWLLEEGS